MINKISLILILFFSCNFSDESIKLSGGYSFVDEGKKHKVIIGKNNYIPCEVIDYDFDNNFIIVKQKPTDLCFYGKDSSFYKEGKQFNYYWIIDNSNKLFLGPLNFKEFSNSLKKLNVSDKLKLKPVN